MLTSNPQSGHEHMTTEFGLVHQIRLSSEQTVPGSGMDRPAWHQALQADIPFHVNYGFLK